MGVLNAIGLWLGLARGMAGQALGLPSPWEHSIRAFEARDRTPRAGPGVPSSSSAVRASRSGRRWKKTWRRCRPSTGASAGR